MAKDAEELKLILDMAANGGKMQAKNEMLLEKIAMLEKQNERLKAENKTLREELSAKTTECEELQAKMTFNEKLNEELDEQESGSQGQFVMVNNFYYVLSWPKTVEYVGKLDSNGRMSAGHFIHHTLPDGVPRRFIKKVDELTTLESHQEKRLADAMEKVAERPTTMNNIYPQDGSTANVGCEMQNPEFKILPSIQNAPVEQSKLKGETTNG